MSHTFSNDFRRFFGRGLAILLPSIVTLWLLWQAFTFVYDAVGKPINRGIQWSVVEVVDFFPEKLQPRWYEVTDTHIANIKAKAITEGEVAPGDTEIIAARRKEQFKAFWENHPALKATGLAIAIILIYLVGMLLSNFVGRRIYHQVEKLIAQIPGFKQVYPHVKQVVEMMFGDKKMAFSTVVLIEYPSAGIWTIGFLTGESIRDIDQAAGARVQSVFIPTSPTPFTGFTINLPKSKIREMDMSVEEALRFVITAGVLAPGAVAPSPNAIESRSEGDPGSPGAGGGGGALGGESQNGPGEGENSSESA
ncbi:MAG: putative membrane protein [Phycisphaerales bacterium]|jgi:uncharacterized membrane protein